MWAVGTGVAHSSIPQKKYEVSHGIFPGQVMAVCKSKLLFDILENRGSSYFFFGTYCVLSGEGSVLNGKSSLCDFNLQKSSPLKGTLFLVLLDLLFSGGLIVTLEFIFYRGKIERLRRIIFKR